MRVPRDPTDPRDPALKSYVRKWRIKRLLAASLIGLALISYGNRENIKRALHNKTPAEKLLADPIPVGRFVLFTDGIPLTGVEGYLYTISRLIQTVSGETNASLVQGGRALCDALDRGDTFPEVVEVIDRLDEEFLGSVELSVAMLISAVTHFCPKYLWDYYQYAGDL